MESLKLRNQLNQQQSQTADVEASKRNESNIRLSYVSKPKLSLKQQIEECQLKLSAKKEVNNNDNNNTIVDNTIYNIIYNTFF